MTRTEVERWLIEGHLILGATPAPHVFSAIARALGEWSEQAIRSMPAAALLGLLSQWGVIDGNGGAVLDIVRRVLEVPHA